MTADIQRWTTALAAPSEGGGFVAYGDYLALKRRLEAAHDRIAALEAKCALFAASLAQSEREVEERDARIAGKVDGWKLVPVKPTMDMVVNGFESWPDEHFSRPEEWAAYEAMTGCQQAAHKARLCYAAMLAAAPTDTVSPAVDAQPVAEAWQPIETAPKDRLIAIWIAGTNAAGQKWSDIPGELWVNCYYDRICGEWRTTRPSGHLRCVPERYVTHWQPLPAPPAALSQHTGDKDD